MIKRERLRRFRVLAPTGPFSGPILGAVLALALIFGAIAGTSPTIGRMAVGAAGGLLLIVISITGRETSLKMMIVWLVFMGLIRRILIPFAGWSDQDPLLLVGPACALMIWLNGRRESPKHPDAVTFLAMLFLVWAFALPFGPLAESFLVDIKGLIFWIPPLIWLFVGRTFPVSMQVKISTLVIALGIPVAIHGLYHNFVGLFSFEYSWVGLSQIGPSIFFEGFKIRPFSSLTSPQEYGAFLAVALAFLWGTILAKHPRPMLRLCLFGLFTTALFLQGTRHIFGLFLLMIVVTSILWTRNFGVKMAMAALAFAMFMTVQMKLIPTEWGDGPIATAVEHQVKGFQSPEQSTAPAHKQMFLGGFETAWENPLGLGLSITTVAAAKVGKYGGGTEWDMSNAFVSFGMPVGILYLVFLILVFVHAIRRFKVRESAYSIAVVGVLIVNFGHIWTGGLYAVSAIVFLAIGAMSRPVEELPEPEVTPERVGFKPYVPESRAMAPARG